MKGKLINGKLIKLAIAVAFGVLCFFAFQKNAWAYGIYQTGNTDTSVTVNWEGQKTATEFRLGYVEIPAGLKYEQERALEDKAKTNAQNGQIKVSKDTFSFTINGLKPQKEYCVYLYYTSGSGDYTYESYAQLSAFTKIKKVTNIAQTEWYKFIEKVDVEWNPIPAYSSSDVKYEVVFMNAKGKVIDKKVTTSTRYEHPIKNSQIYLIKVRATRTPNSSYYKGMPKETTAWDIQYLFTQPDIIASKLTNSKLTIMWEKIQGVTSYDVYVSIKEKKGYQKVASVKGTKNAISIKKLYKKKLSKLKRKAYFVYVVPNKKVNGKIYKKGVTYSFLIQKGKNRITRKWI